MSSLRLSSLLAISLFAACSSHAPDVVPDGRPITPVDAPVDGQADAMPDATPDATVNAAPVANAGPDRTASPGDHLVLDGRLSTDPEGAPLTYAWLLTSSPAGSAATLAKADTATPELTVDAAGFYEVSLAVSDGTSKSTDTVRIAVMDSLPLAHAGADVSVAHGATVTLDGSGSVDPDGEPLTYAWTLVSAPAGSTAALTGATTVKPTLVADLPGAYTARLVVRDAHGSSAPDDVVVTAINHAPHAVAGADVEVQLGKTATLDGSASSDADGDALTYAWSITARPAGSTAVVAAPSAAKTSLQPDLGGEYDLLLTVSDGVATSTATTRVLVEDVVQTLAGDVRRAEYAAATARIVALTTDAHVLVIDPSTGAVQSIALALDGSSLSVAPDGKHAVVGHDGWISVLDLATATVTKTMAVAVPVGDVVDGGNGWAYVLPAKDQWVAVHSINLATGADSVSARSIYAGTVARKSPTTSTIYLADTGLSPSNMESWTIAGGAAAYAHSSPYWGDYPFCGAFWFSDDGARIFSRCANVFHATSDASTDLKYAGSLGKATTLVSLTQSTAAGRVVAIFDNGFSGTDADTRLQLFADPFLTSAGTKAMPMVIANHALLLSHGRFVFADKDGKTLRVIAHVDGASPRTVLWSTTY